MMEKETAIRVCERLEEMLNEPLTSLYWSTMGLFGKRVADEYLLELSEKEGRAFLRGIKVFLEHDRIEGVRNVVDQTEF